MTLHIEISDVENKCEMFLWEAKERKKRVLQKKVIEIGYRKWKSNLRISGDGTPPPELE